VIRNYVRSITVAAILSAVLLGSTIAPVTAQTAGNSGQVIGSPDIDLNAPTQEFEPGTQAELRLEIVNRGSIRKGGPAEYENRVTTARGVTAEVESGSAPIEINTGPVSIGNVPTGTASAPPVNITIKDSAEPGTYRVPVEISYASTRSVNYDSFGPEYNDFDRSRTEYVTIRVRSQSRFDIVDSTTTSQVGDRGNLTVTIENVGDRAARDASVAAASSSDELLFGTGSKSSTANVGSWEPGEQRVVEYTVEMVDDATLRAYSVDLTVNYRDIDGIDRSSRTLTTGVRPTAEQSFSVTNVSTNLRVGEEGTVSGTVVNNGPDAVTNPVVIFSPSNPNIVVDSSEYAIPDIAPGERANFEYTVTISDAGSASVQQFNLTTRYRNARGDVQRSDVLETKARIEPKRDRFIIKSATDEIAAGSDQAVTIQITNNGEQPLQNVEAKAFVESPLSSDNDEAIVTSLAANETAEFTIALSAASDALPKTYPVSLDFQYEMPDGDSEVSKTYTTAIVVTEPEDSGFPLPLVLGALIIIGVAGIGGWRRWSS